MIGLSWIIFDADNTLWNVEGLYDRSRRLFCEYLGRHGIDPLVAERFQQQRDKLLYATYGYSACRFARSFEDTTLALLPQAKPSMIRHVRAMALAVFEETAPLAEGLAEVISLLKRKYKLGILTAGERWVQERRLRAFSLREQFDTIEIVEEKTPAVFEQICDKHHIDRGSSWMIGDSLKSDILPSIKVGLRAIWITTRNWSLIETHGHAVPDEVIMIKSMRELATVPNLLKRRQSA